MHLPVNSPMTPAVVERDVRAQSLLFWNLHEIVELARRQRLAEPTSSLNPCASGDGLRYPSINAWWAVLESIGLAPQLG
jgi:hypothetical protein